MNKSKQPSSDQLNEIIRTQFGLDPIDHVVNVELVFRETDPEKYDLIRAEFVAQLAQHSNRDAIRRKTYFGETFSVHLQSWFAYKEVEGLTPELMVHYPICNVDEIRRIATPNTAADHLLTMRADAIADSARLKRVFMKRRERDPTNWSLTSHFTTSAFEQYISLLPTAQRVTCHQVAAGMAFIREPNGSCIRSPHGDFILISESLQTYLYYMNVFLLGQQALPMDDCMAALMIALRTMFLTETPDFDLDPRGQLPEEVDRNMADMVDDQMQFVVGHEYAHLLLHHSDAGLAREPPLTVSPAGVDGRPIQYYTPRQEQEFAADVGSLLHVQLTDQELARRLLGATWFFLGLDILYAVSAYVNPSIHAPKTHPEPIERIWSLRQEVLGARILETESIYSDHEMAELVAWVTHMKSELLKKFVPYHVEELERYGSVYLPSFRGPELHDRLDY